MARQLMSQIHMKTSHRYLIAMLLALGAWVSTPACASSGGYPRDGYSNRRVERRAYDNGFRDGIRAGRDDARHHERFDPIRARRYREGDHDYDRRYGSQDDYRREYRAAFQQGYEQGYRQYRGRD
jgi:hypothetical protein